MLVKGQINRSTGQNRDPRNRPTINAVNWSLTKEKRQCSGAKIVFSQMVLKQLTFTFKKMSLARPYAQIKINSKWITDLNVKCKTIKLLDGDRRILRWLRWFWIWQWLFRYNARGMTHEKNNLISCISFKLQPALQKFYQENEHTSHRLGDNVHRRYSLQN